MTGLVVGALATPIQVYLPNFYAAHLGVSIGLVGAIFLAIRVLDIIFDPLMGMVMDRTRTPIGRYRFWLLVSAPVLMLGGYMAFMAPVGASGAYVAGWLAVLYVGYSLALLSQAAWGAVLARRYHERSRLFSWVQFVGVAGAGTILILNTVFSARGGGNQVLGVHVMGWFIIVAAPLTSAVVCLATPEPLPPAGPKRLEATLRDYLSLARRPDMMRLIASDFALSFGPGFTGPLYLFFFQKARNYTPTQANLLLLVYILAGLAGAPVLGVAGAPSRQAPHAHNLHGALRGGSDLADAVAESQCGADGAWHVRRRLYRQLVRISGPRDGGGCRRSGPS